MLAPNILRYGHPGALPQQRLLRAGPLTVVYEAGDLRYIRFGAREVVRRIYVAVRDRNWGTIAGHMTSEQIEARTDSFRISYVMAHRQGDVDFGWRGEISGATDGTLRFVMNGEARSSFLSNRTGFCVLHPSGCAGTTARIAHADSSSEAATFPTLIAPQLVENGQIHPVYPFAEMQALSHEIQPGVWAEVRFAGDLFELEDQRNWIDGSYKTYCRPLRLPFPFPIAAGTQLRQSVTVRIRDDRRPADERQQGKKSTRQGASEQASRSQFPVSRFYGQQPATGNRQPPNSSSFTVHPLVQGAIPTIGLGMASHGHPLTAQEIERLRRLNLGHLRVDLNLQGVAWRATLQHAAHEARKLDVPLEIALFLSVNANQELAALRQTLEECRPAVARWLVFHANEKATSAEWVRRARAHLATFVPAALFASGTNVYFTELNRGRPDTSALDLVTYSVNPQVHAFDNASLVETASVIAATVESARAFSGGKPIIISPVTFKPRFNPVATEPEREPPPGVLPPQVDQRQMSLFGACWTLTSLKYLAESNVASATYYETTGWRGVIETAAGSPLPEQFFSLPNAVFPLYHVLADLGESKGGAIITSQSSDTLTIDGMAIKHGTHVRVLLANLTNQPQRTTVTGLPNSVEVRVLDEHNALEAMQEPEMYRAQAGVARATNGGTLELALQPYAIARIDGEHSTP